MDGVSREAGGELSEAAARAPGVAADDDLHHLRRVAVETGDFEIVDLAAVVAVAVKFLERIGVPTVKPRATLVFGRSRDWGEDERVAYRILIRSYHDITILTYDHVLDRADRILRSHSPVENPRRKEQHESSVDDIPF